MIFVRDKAPNFARISEVELRAALDDPRLPESFTVEPVGNYPALAIRTDETDGYWYIGYIDLFDAEFHPRERGERDGINTVDGEWIYAFDPEDYRHGYPRVSRKCQAPSRTMNRIVSSIYAAFIGWWYGYPSCCVSSYCWQSLLGRQPGLRYRLKHEDAIPWLPFVPCSKHHHRIVAGDLGGCEWVADYRPEAKA